MTFLAHIPAGPQFSAQIPQMFSMPLSDGDEGTSQTIDRIRGLVDAGIKDLFVNRAAIGMVRAARVRQFDFAGEIKSVYEWVRRNIRFIKDPVGKEALRTARETLTVGAGDCDCINSVLLPALLGTIGHRTRLVTISSHPDAPELFSHIYAEVLLNGRWVPIDAARVGPRFGRGPESYFRKRVWSLSDDEFEDVAGFGGLMAYQASSTANPLGVRPWNSRLGAYQKANFCVPTTGLSGACAGCARRGTSGCGLGTLPNQPGAQLSTWRRSWTGPQPVYRPAALSGLGQASGTTTVRVTGRGNDRAESADDSDVNHGAGYSELATGAVHRGHS